MVERAPPPIHEPEDWIARGIELERHDPEGSARAYRQAIETDPSQLDAWVNLGLLQHELRRHNDALKTYLEALDVVGAEGVLLFNLGVLLEDMQRKREAIQAYEGAVRVDPRLADAHYNLALLLEKSGKPREAIQHMAQYRKLSARKT